MANRKDQSNRAPSLPRPEQTERMRGASAQPPARTEAQRQALLERLQPAQEQSPALFQERSTEDRATGRTPSATRQRRIPPALPPRERQTQPATAPPSQPTRAVERQTTSEPIRPSEPASTRQEQTTPPGVSDRVDVPVTPVHQREMSLDALRVEISRQRGFDISHRHTYYTTVPAPPPSREDIENVPESARSSVSRFRRDSRLRQPYTSREERERVRIAQHAMQLATQLSTLHAYLQHLITTQSGESRYTPIMQDPDVHEPPIMIPTELQQAIDSGLINEFPGRLVIAGLDRVNELFDELPGFENQYRYNYQRLERDLALEDAVEDLLTKLDIVMLLVDIAAPAYLALRATRTLLRRASASLIRRVGRESIEQIARRGVSRVVQPRRTSVRPGQVRSTSRSSRALTPDDLDFDRGFAESAPYRSDHRGSVRWQDEHGRQLPLASELRRLHRLQQHVLTPPQIRTGRRFIGRRLNSQFRRIWRNVLSPLDREELRQLQRLRLRSQTTTDPTERRILEENMYDLARNRLYPRVARKFWNAVMDDRRLHNLLEGAGLTLRRDHVPAWILPDGSRVRLSLEHVIRVSDDPSRAIDPTNLIISPMAENTDLLEAIRSIEMVVQ